MVEDPRASPGAPPPKQPMPPLDVRAPRPSAVRLRRGAVAIAALGAGGLLAGALAWAFVIQPELRARGAGNAIETPEPTPAARVRPSERVTALPATYAQLGRLPEPRRLSGGAEAASGAVDAPSGPRPAEPAPIAPAPPRADPAQPARASGLFFASPIAALRAPAPAAERTPATTDRGGDPAAVYNGHRLMAPLSPYELKAGALLPAVLLTGIDTGRPGPVLAVVTDNVFDSVSGRHLVVPQGARLIGRHEGESRQGDRRAYIAWERLILPNGKSVVLTQAEAVDAQGAVGIEGRVDRHLRPLALASLAAGAVTALGQAARDRDGGSGGWLGDAGGAASIEAAQVGGRLVDRELAVRPVIRLAPGARVRVLIARDLILEPYAL